MSDPAVRRAMLSNGSALRVILSEAQRSRRTSNCRELSEEGKVRGPFPRPRDSG